jgi:UDP-glucose 4-epimerase
VKKKSLVTGAAGFIGSNLVDELIGLGHDVVAIDDESAELNENFYWNDSASNHKINICDYDSIRPLFDGVDYVFHLAAESRLQTSIINPINAVNRNVVGTTVVLQCSREAGVKRFLYSSTSSGYGNNPTPNVELQPDDCLNPYSVSKVAGEKICKLYTELYGLQTIIFRYFNVYGERSPSGGQYAPVIGVFLKQYERGEPLTIVGDGLQRRDFVHVLDVVSANIKAAEAQQLDGFDYGKVYNVSNGYNVSVLEIAKMISDNYVFVERRAGEARETLADTKKFSNKFGWKPKVNLHEWIANEKRRIDDKIFNRSD